jgi:hypothetical protein
MRLLLSVSLLALLLISTISAALPVQAVGGPGALPAAAPQQTTTPLQFTDNVAIQPGFATNNTPLIYTFFGAAGETVVINLDTLGAGVNFEFAGSSNNQVYKSLSNPQRQFTFVLPLSQEYRITVFNSSSVGAVFTLTVTRTPGGGGQPQRINFAPGQTTAEVTGTAGPGISPQYIFTLGGAQSVRIQLLPGGTQANFAVRGNSDQVIYKQPFDPSRDWTSPPLPQQDYVVTVTSPQAVQFTLVVTLLGTPGGAERIILAPGQSTAVLNGSLFSGATKYYVIFAAAGQQLRVLLTSNPSGSVNFAIDGNTDRVVYKSLSDGRREVTIPIPVSQDYLITLVNFGATQATYTLEVGLPTPLPPTTTLTPLPTLPSGCTTEVIQNGGFETDGFWIFGDSPVPPVYESTVVRSGLRAVRMGIDPALGGGVQNHKAFSSVRQPFQIPAEASIAQLRWWNFYRTEEAQTDSPGLGQDKQEVILLKPDLSTVAVLRSVRRNNNAWIEELVDLTPYRGQSLVLYFNVYNDGNGQRTWQFLDDVQINVCFPAVTATPISATPMPPMPLAAAAAAPASATIVLPTPVVVQGAAGGTPVPAGGLAADATAQAATGTAGAATAIAALPTAVFTDLPAAAGTATALALALGEQAAQSAQATQAAQATQLAGTVLNGAAGVNGEPDVVQLPPDTAGTAAAAGTGQGVAQTAAPPILLIPPTPTPIQLVVQAQAPAGGAATAREGNVQTVGGLRLFDRPLNDVLLWGGIMLGIPALIILLGTLIWMASRKS